MSLLLHVPYEEKDEAKSLGARWNPVLKQWYAPYKFTYYKLRKWFFSNQAWIMNDNSVCPIICDYFYIVTGMANCSHCGQLTSTITVAFENYLEINGLTGRYKYETGTIHLAALDDMTILPKKTLQYIHKVFGCYFDRGIGKICNHCLLCHHEQRNMLPFNVWNNEEMYKELVLYKIKLDFDIIHIPDIIVCSEDDLLKEWSTIKEIII